jgi:hypothetical protein
MKKKITERYTELNDEGLHHLSSSPDIARVIEMDPRVVTGE